MEESQNIPGILGDDLFNSGPILLTESERHHLLVEWNQTRVEYPRDQTIHQLFAMQAAKTPEAVALVFQDEQLTYRELNERANQLAHHLRLLGVKPDTLVGICVERSMAMVIGLLGILKAGGAYVPLDPVYPPERLAFMVADAQAAVVLTQQALVEHLPGTSEKAVCLDRDWLEITRQPTTNPDVPVQPHHLAYVIYTSGSTGQPKGVAIEHRNAVNFIHWGRATFSDAEMSGVLAATSICFDLSVFELFVTLSRGGRVILAENALQLPLLAARNQVSLVNTVPSAMSELLSAGNLPDIVQTVNLAGEPLSAALVDRLYALKQVSRVNDLYGPTETTTYSTFTLRQQGVKPTIGRPIANTTVYILDGRLQPVPVGVAGELHIGGMGLARGYLNRPELTAEKFITHPFSDEPGARLYKTGDLCRYLADGNIEYLGRIDQQVKIRGFRIELGEVESVLGSHPAIRECVVVARTAADGSKTLAAYLVVSIEPAPTVAGLREFLLQQLPDYMVPGAFVLLDKLPLTPNGKVDRKALPVPDANRLASGVEFVPPSTPTETTLAQIWSDLLGVKQVGLHDNFFALGGHSLAAVRMAFRIHDKLQVEVPACQTAKTPTLAEMSRIVDENRKNTNAKRGIQPRRGTLADKFPVSFNQQQLWFIDQLAPGSSVYNVPLALRLQGQVNPLALRESLNYLIQRHESLRTTFQAENGEPMQIIAPHLIIELPVVSLKYLPAAERKLEAHRRIQVEAGQPFDLQRGPLVRAQLLEFDQADNLLLLTLHHIIFDGWSEEVLLRELTASYTAFDRKTAPELPMLPVQYADYALWQREHLTPDLVEKHLTCWRQQLAGVPTILDLPLDRARDIQKNQSSEHLFKLDDDATAQLRKLGQKNDATLFATLLAAFHALLHRYSRQEQVLIGVPFAERTHSEVENLIGFFVNSLPVKADFVADPSFTELLRQVRDTIWAVQARQDLPFERLVRELQPAREPGCNPLFQVLVVLEVGALKPCQGAGVTFDLKEAAPPETMFDLNLSLTDQGNEVDCVLRYNADLFDASTVARLAGGYQKLLTEIVADPNRKLSAIPLLTESEQYQLLVEWNHTKRKFADDTCLQKLFEAQAEKTPSVVAVSFENQRLSFHELNRRANQLAHHLRSLGTRSNSPVGIHLGSSPEFIISMLAVLKAGGAYLPLDPTLPAERLRFMIQDASAAIMISGSHLPDWPDHDFHHLVHLHDHAAVISACAEIDPTPINGREDLAYLLYTSGSTGRPKGVQMPHGALLNLIHWQIEHSACIHNHKTLQFAPVGFDVCFQEIFSTLVSGGTLVIPQPEERKDFKGLIRLIERENIRRVFLPFVALENLAAIACESSQIPLALREVITAGEQLRITPTLRFFFQQLNGTLLVNQYGPTESHVVTFFELKNAPSNWSLLPPIGRPIANTTVYILDGRLQPVPVGVAGELHIGGMGLARGYLNRPELTAEKFITHPFSDEPGARLYKTGDLCRYLADGNIEYLGRIDQQVKIRGFRIELGEVESVLGSHPAIRECVVVARTAADGSKTLAAYLVVSIEPAPTVAGLREFLLQQLPDYMVPGAFVLLDKLPLTPNGKVDRKALPVPDANRLASGVEFVPPSTPTETTLAQIWSDLLGVKQVGLHDNFFALGGHSLAAVRMAFRIHDKLQVEVTVRQVAETPTIAALSRVVDEARNDGQVRLGIRPRNDAGTNQLPVSFNQEQLWFIDQLEPGGSAYNLPMVLRLRGPLQPAALQQSLNHLLARHEALRTTFRTADGVPFQIIAPQLAVELAVTDLETVPVVEREPEAQRRMQAEAGRPFDLKSGPLIRAELLRLNAEDHILLLTVHHIVFDGWSMDVLLRELATGYTAFCQGQPPELPPLPVQYADYAVWQREHLTPEVIEQHLDYWRQQLAGVPTSLELPTDYPHAAVEHNRGAEHAFKLTGETAATLRQLGQQQDTTLFIVLLTAFQVLLHRYSRQEQIVIGVPFAGRTGSEVENLIGFFVNTLPVKADFTTNPGFTELLRQVQNTVWEAQAHQALPFAELVRELQPTREKNRNPLFQLCMIHDVPASATAPLPGLAMELEMTEPAEAKFELTLLVTERAGGLECVLHYHAGLFEAATVARLVANYQTLLAAIAANPQERISQLTLLSAVERRRLLEEWNQTRVEYPRDQTIHQLFEAQAARTPEAVAVVFAAEQLTYRELNERANQLAHHLHTLDVGPDMLVGIFVERSIDYAIGVLGILKAGGAYVPLDSHYPTARLQFLIADSGIAVMLTNQPLPQDLAVSEITVVNLSADLPVIQHCARVNFKHSHHAESLAYVIYTSGSTGQPKGVAILHRGVVRLVRGQNYAAFDHRQRFLLLASTSFDAATFELWGPLLNGGICVVFPEQDLDFQQLEIVIRQQGVTCLWLTAGLFNQIIDARHSVFKTVQQVLTGGEALSVSHVQKAVNQFPRLRLTNGYGPTESTTFACCHAISPEETFSTGSVSIGRPIANTQLYILDGHLQPMPVGVAGELHIGGDGLARGYLNRPELTAEKFIAHPFNAEPGARLYKTGDLCRYLADGNIEYLGRMDQQVKLRGFRIELGEIEAVLGSHPAIRECVVVALTGVDGTKTLAAYLLVRTEPSPTVAELREFLLAKLPDYMVPGVFVVLERLPLTPNGKVDRKALPAPDENRLASGVAFVLPSTPVEIALAGIWSELLGVKEVGLHDNFFALGGHSLLAVRMAGEIRQRLKFDLPLRMLFQHPTVRELAKLLQNNSDISERRPELILLNEGRSGSELYLLIDEGSLGLFKLAHYLDKSQPLYASVVPLTEAALKASAKKQLSTLPNMEDWAAEHVALIRNRHPSGPVLLAGHCFGGVLAFEVARQLQATGIPVGAVLLLDTWMTNTSFWWEKKAWLREHFGRLLQQGPQYLWSKGLRRIRLEKKELTARLELAIRNDFNLQVPWAIIARIYRHAMKGYRPKPLATRGVLFVSQNDWIAKAYRPLDDSLGARKMFADEVRVISVPGNHVTILNEEHLPELAEKFNQCLESFRNK